MFTFFRRIRKGLLGASSTSKYLIYAIGEIALVVIGILIALQINNWNERRKDRLVERDYMIRVIADIKRDTAYFSIRMERDKHEAKNYYDFVHAMYQEQKSLEDFQNLNSICHWFADDFLIQNDTYNEMKSSGKMDLITDSHIKEQIVDYYRNSIQIIGHVNEMNRTGIEMYKYYAQHLGKYIRPLFSDLYDEVHMMEGKDWLFINQPHSELFRGYEGAAGFYYFKSKRSVKYCENQFERATSLIKSLQSALERS